MTVYVFLGPTLDVVRARTELEAVYLPPAAQGDVYRVVLARPEAIGIVDGYFEHVPAVWHKEILWAMSQGIHVFGSASMGALRAAELEPFGMEGAGAIFEAYRDGRLEDDDEVAVLHGPADVDYAGQSEAMVNIRATLRAAEATGLIRSATRDLLERTAKSLYYPDRSYPRVLEMVSTYGGHSDEIEALRAWLPVGRIDQKREDAIAMLRLMRERLLANVAPKQTDFVFEHTEFWDKVIRDTPAAAP